MPCGVDEALCGVYVVCLGAEGTSPILSVGELARRAARERTEVAVQLLTQC